MKAYEYVGVDPAGHRVTGTAWSVSEEELDGRLGSSGLVLVRARVVADERRKRPLRLGRDGLVHFTNQLATVTAAGVSLVEGLDGIGARLEEDEARKLVGEMASAIRAGRTLSEAMEAYPRAFPAVYRAVVRAGEASGALDRVLTRLARHLEWVRAMRATTLQALVYPTILCVAVLGLVAILLGFVLPRIVSMFPGGEADLPAETRAVMAASAFLTSNAGLLAALAVAAVLGVVVAQRRPGGRRALHGLLLRTPLLGPLAAELATTKFAGTAGILQSAGCEVYTTLSIAATTCGNAVAQEGFLRVADRVRAGATIGGALAEEPGVDPLLVQMVDVGERTGELDTCLERLVAHYDEEVPRKVKRLLSLLEPGLLVGAGAVVGFILLAALTPIFDLYQSMV